MCRSEFQNLPLHLPEGSMKQLMSASIRLHNYATMLSITASHRAPTELAEKFALT